MVADEAFVVGDAENPGTVMRMDRRTGLDGEDDCSWFALDSTTLTEGLIGAQVLPSSSKIQYSLDFRSRSMYSVRMLLEL